MCFKVAETNILFLIGVNILDFQPKPNPQIEKNTIETDSSNWRTFPVFVLSNSI